jgi:hypothetical protein
LTDFAIGSREKDSHCWYKVLKTMGRSIVKQREKEKNSNFNEENCVVMLIQKFKKKSKLS